MSNPEISERQWAQYERDGYVRLGKVLDEEDLGALQKRIDDIMLGHADLDYARLYMQLDSTTGAYENLSGGGRGHQGATLDYRKIQDLEFDPLFLAYMQRPLFAEICARIYGASTRIAAFRAMFMNKPAQQGTLLPWHQDRWTNLDRDPLITVWTALDPATRANGCVQVIPGSHKFGLINPSHPSAFLTEEQARDHEAKNQTAYVEMEAGEAVLLHNWLLHRSDTNTTSTSRRAFSVCYMDARTHDSNGSEYSLVFGEGAMQIA
jgi:phytanoyl-CoA hydroxylase